MTFRTGLLLKLAFEEMCQYFCSTHGKCFYSNGKAVCFCAQGYTGHYCESNIDECATYPCSTNGTQKCRDLVNGYECICRSQFYGQKCELNFDGNKKCRHNVGKAYKLLRIITLPTLIRLYSVHHLIVIGQLMYVIHSDMWVFKLGVLQYITSLKLTLNRINAVAFAVDTLGNSLIIQSYIENIPMIAVIALSNTQKVRKQKYPELTNFTIVSFAAIKSAVYLSCVLNNSKTVKIYKLKSRIFIETKKNAIPTLGYT